MKFLPNAPQFDFQYPQYQRAHWQYMKSVVILLLQFNQFQQIQFGKIDF